MRNLMKRCPIVLVVLVASVLFLSGCREEEAKETLVCGLAPAQETYILGEPIWIYIVVVNKSDEEETVSGWVPNDRMQFHDNPSRVTEYFTITQGEREVGFIVTATANFHPRLTVPPKTTMVFKVDLAQNYEMDQPGEYVVDFSGYAPASQYHDHDGTWRGLYLPVPITIRIVEAEELVGCVPVPR